MYSLTIEDSNGQIAEQFSFYHGSYLIGRQENCDIVLPSSSVSRQHANIFVKDGRCYIEDLNSANGVTVDGQRVVKQRHLGTASQVRIGDYYLYLEYRGNEQIEDQDVRQTLYINDSADHNKLVRINDEFAGEAFKLSEVENTIGRTDDNFILLSDPSISREHALISREGATYTLIDLGSSNGTRVNGKEVTGTVDLQPGDIVEFGSVEFVFARGDEQIDPSDYASTASSTQKLLLASVVTVVLLVGIVAGGLIVFGFWSLSGDGGGGATAEQGSLESEVSSLVAKGNRRLEDEDWDAAIEIFNEALALKPNHEQAKDLRARARREKEAETLYEKGVKLSEEGDHDEALSTLEEIPEGTVAHEQAQMTLEHVRKTIGFRLRNEAEPLVESGSSTNWKRAHEKLQRATSLVPDDEKAASLLEKVRGKMDGHEVDYDQSGAE